MDPALLAAANLGQTPAVAQGTEIGRVGHSGTAVGDHLHWELRVGTPYSLEWQLANPTSQYGANNFGFDPHVHPLLLTVPSSTNTLALSLTTKPTSRLDGRVRITTDDAQPLVNRVGDRLRHLGPIKNDHVVTGLTWPAAAGSGTRRRPSTCSDAEDCPRMAWQHRG